MSGLERLAKGLPITVLQLAELASMGPATIYRAIERGEIQVIRIGTRMTVPAHVAKRILLMSDALAT